MTIWRIEVLGPFRVLGENGAECAIPRGKGTALLAYLATEAEGLDRDVLASMLWPEASPSAARHSLRQALSTLRKRLDGDPFITGDRIALDAGVVQSDVWDFQAAAASADLERALDLVRGEPFTDVDPGISHDFEVWLERRRVDLLQDLGALLETAGRAAIDAGQEHRVLGLVQVGVRAGLDESALRAAIYGANGHLPPWATAAVGPDALEALAFRARPGVPPALALVLEDEPGWAMRALGAAMAPVPPGERPVIVDLAAPDGEEGGLTLRLLRALCSAPGGAAVSPRTMSVLERLEDDASFFEESAGHADVDWALEDALDAVLHEGPLVVCMPASGLHLRDANSLAKALSLQGGEGALLVVSASSERDLDGLPVQALGKTASSTRRIREVAPDVEVPAVASPPHAAPRARPWHRRPVTLATASVALLAAAFWGVGLRGGTGPVDLATLLAGYDVMFCSYRSGVPQYYRWSSRSGLVERFTADTAASGRPRKAPGEVRCRHTWFGVPSSDSIPLLVSKGDTVAYRLYENAMSRGDAQGTPVHLPPGQGEMADERMIFWPVPGERGALVTKWKRGASLELTDSDVEVISAGHSHDPNWVLLRIRGEDGPYWIRVHAETRDAQTLIQDSLAAIPTLRGDSVVYARGRAGEDEDGSLELYLLDLSTGTQERLTENGWNDYQVRWSPTGQHICWQSERLGHYESEIMVMDLGTRQRWNLSDSPGRDHNCRFTPDGRGVVYESFRTGHQDVFLQAVEGGPAHNITNHPDWDQFVGFVRGG